MNFFVFNNDHVGSLESLGENRCTPFGFGFPILFDIFTCVKWADHAARMMEKKYIPDFSLKVRREEVAWEV
jgi:hypothetical protein